MPATHRTIFQLVPLHVASLDYVENWLDEAFKGQDLEIHEEHDRNVLLLQGGADIVARAVDMLEVLDQPLLQGKHGVILQPVFLEADDLVNELRNRARS